MGNKAIELCIETVADKTTQTKVCQEKTLDTKENMLYDTQGDDEWKNL